MGCWEGGFCRHTVDRGLPRVNEGLEGRNCDLTGCNPASVLLQAAPLPAFDITGKSQQENSLHPNAKAGLALSQGLANGRW